MSHFQKLRREFDTNWTTILTGWDGLGVFSSWTDRRDEFPPLLSTDEICAYANERLAVSSDHAEQQEIIELSTLNAAAEGRGAIRDALKRLSDIGAGDPSLELRKWRLVLLEDLLDHPPQDPVYGLVALTEFWQRFGFPKDGPHEVQGRGNDCSPTEYYTERNLLRLLDRHRIWLQNESEALNEKGSPSYDPPHGSPRYRDRTE